MSEERPGLPEPDDTDDLDLDDLVDDPEPDDSDELDAGDEEATEAAEPAEETPPPEPKRPSRNERRVQTLARRLKETREEVARLRQQPPPQPPQQIDPYRQAELERQEAERVMMMAPHEVAKYYADKNRTETTQALTRQQVQFGDMLDRQNFESVKRDEKAAIRLAPQVEDYLIQARNAGMNPTREAIYNLLVGQEARASLRRSTDKQRRNGQARIAAQTVAPGQARSGAASPRRQRGEPTAQEDEALLRGVRLGDVW